MKPYSAIILVRAAPDFSIGIACDADEVIAIDYLPACDEVAPQSPLANETVRQLRAYLADPRFTFGLPLRPHGTAFQRRVWQAISAIPQGSTRTYGEVAQQLASGPRAIGGACGANPFPIIVPCHRVIASGGGLGGFGGSEGRGHDLLLAIKRWLLAHENAGLQQTRRAA
jgi:methylated-DNA-[protein]-cysteine S-methyltransferase